MKKSICKYHSNCDGREINKICSENRKCFIKDGRKSMYKGMIRINTDGTVEKEPWTFADDKTVSETIKEHYFGNGYEGNIVHNLDGSITIDIAREKTPREFTRIKGTLYRVSISNK